MNAVFAVAGLISLIGVLGLLIRKNLVIMLMSLEIVILGAIMALVGAARYHSSNGMADGALFVPFVLVIAACEVCVGLSLVMKIYKNQKTYWVDELDAKKP